MRNEKFNPRLIKINFFDNLCLIAIFMIVLASADFANGSFELFFTILITCLLYGFVVFSFNFEMLKNRGVLLVLLIFLNFLIFNARNWGGDSASISGYMSILQNASNSLHGFVLISSFLGFLPFIFYIGFLNFLSKITINFIILLKN